MLSIGIGSRTSTGGVVIEGNDNIRVNGLIASSVGQKATCPACKEGIGPIVAVGERTSMLPAGPAARAGDYVACGCPPGSNVLLPEGTITIGTGRGYSQGAAVGSPRGSAQHAAPSPTKAQPSSNTASAGSQFADSSTNVLPPSPSRSVANQAQYQWTLAQSEYFIRQLAYLPVEGVGANGTFFISGHLALHGRVLYISAMGFTAAMRMGKVHFSASVTAVINGKEIFSGPLTAGEGNSMWPDDEYSPIGSVSIELPAPDAGDSISVTIHGTYIYSAAEGRAVPMPPRGSVTLSVASEVQKR